MAQTWQTATFWDLGSRNSILYGHFSWKYNQNIENLYANMNSSDRDQATFCPTKIRKDLGEDLISPQTIKNNFEFYPLLSLPVLTTMAEDPRTHNHCPSIYKKEKK